MALLVVPQETLLAALVELLVAQWLARMALMVSEPAPALVVVVVPQTLRRQEMVVMAVSPQVAAAVAGLLSTTTPQATAVPALVVKSGSSAMRVIRPAP